MQNDLRIGTSFLRCIAILLVINSHMDLFYPIKELGTGGAIGIALFFMLSSYGLLLSEQQKSQSFIEYYIKRLERIYPACWTSIVFLILPLTAFYAYTDSGMYPILKDSYHLNDPLDFFGMIFYPPPEFWFLDALMIYYLFGFIFVRNYSFKKMSYAYVPLLTVYFFFYSRVEDFTILTVEQEMRIKLVFYFMVFLSGLYFASNRDRFKNKGIQDLIALVFVVCLMYAHKFMMYKGLFPEFQFVQQFLVFPILYFSLKVARSPVITDSVKKFPFLLSVISVVSAMTLELYIVHGPIRVLMLPYFTVFPLNIMVYLPVVFLTAYLFNRFNKRFVGYLSKIN